MCFFLIIIICNIVFTFQQQQIIEVEKEYDKNYNKLHQDWFHIDDKYLWIVNCYWDHKTRKNDDNFINKSLPLIRCIATDEFTDKAKQKFLNSKCELYYSDNLENEVILSDIFSVSVDEIDDIYPEDKARAYYFYTIPPSNSRIPTHLSFIPYNIKNEPWNHDVSGQPRKYIIPILGNYNGIYNSILPNNIKKNLMSCVKPFYDVYNDYGMILNFFIIQIALGVQHFTIFDSGNINPKILKIIQSIQDMGVSISILPYNYREIFGHIQHQSIQG